MTKPERWLAVSTAVVALAACSASSGGNTHPALSHSPLPDRAELGVISGRFLAVGGPYGATPSPQRGRIVLRLKGRLVMTDPVGQDGRYQLQIAPGTYWIRGYSPQYDGGTAACQAVTPDVTVRAGAITHLNIYCQRK
ncbi:MAG TPA: hypothetical protein VG650_00540 [Mycobacteriales bacterium]|nr:hypothetical protein [Mycobacteriales bacterium]